MEKARLLLTMVLLAFTGGAPAATAAEPDAQDLANRIFEATGVRGGLIVHLGCGDGRLTAALGADEKYTVHGLDADRAQVEAAREHVAARGLYGPVSVERLAGPALPYADNLINLVVAEDRGDVSVDEILRVLAPRGVAYMKEGGRWEKTVKPRPENIDEWSHFLHDAGNNAVARDEQVGPPRSLQWVAPPLWLRSHETPSGIQGLVSAGGITDQRLPESWSLVCRDAFNGRLLWKRPVAPWGWPEWASDKFGSSDWTTVRGGRTVVPDENQRRLVADGDRLYATLGYRAPLSILDAATGQVLTTVESTQPVKEILVSDGVVVVHSGGPQAQSARRGDAPQKSESVLSAVKGDSGKLLWRKETASIRSLFLAVDGGRVVFQGGAKLSCLSLADGKPLWEVEGPKGQGRTLVAHDGVVVIYAQKVIEARDAATGDLLWRREGVPPSSGSESPDLFVTGGLVWRGMVPVNEELKAIGKSEDAMAIGYDLQSGEEAKRIVVHRLRSPEHHHRCYRNKATDRYIISGMEGAEFMDLLGNDHCQNNWLRGACKHGVMPCNGLLYVPADQCFCQPGAKILGTTAVAAERPSRREAVPDEQRLEKGEAFAAVGSAEALSPDDWPTYRHDPARHGTTPCPVSPDVTPAWQAALGGRLTAPVAAGGRVYVASSDAHTVYALDAATGKRLWKFVAGGRVDSPPTVFKGRILFGSADGRVYCLRASDGALAWRFLAAPRDRRIGCFDQIESVWPVHGSVLVRDGVAYVTAGRSTYLDGGIRIYGLDPSTGEVLHKTTLPGPTPRFWPVRAITSTCGRRSSRPGSGKSKSPPSPAKGSKT
ncbi:MAG: outer membrane protein assembly factor BamB family protein [Planctomycetota bacterium]|jgi:SAM-dependent methyltransferase